MTGSITVRDLFPAAPLRLPAVPTGLTHLVSDSEWRQLAPRVDDLLDINVVDVLVNGWKKEPEVRTQLRVTAQDPSRTAVVGIGPHSLDSTHYPSIELRSKGHRLAELSFPIELTFLIAGVALTLRHGAICEIHTGEMWVRGAMKFESTVILERDLCSSPLPDTIVLDPEN